MASARGDVLDGKQNHLESRQPAGARPGGLASDLREIALDLEILPAAFVAQNLFQPGSQLGRVEVTGPQLEEAPALVSAGDVWNMHRRTGWR